MVASASHRFLSEITDGGPLYYTRRVTPNVITQVISLADDKSVKMSLVRIGAFKSRLNLVFFSIFLGTSSQVQRVK